MLWRPSWIDAMRHPQRALILSGLAIVLLLSKPVMGVDKYT